MNMLNIHCWNCMGVSRAETTNWIQNLLKKHNPYLVCLVESKAEASRVDRFYTKFARLWNWAAIAAEGYYGGIIVMWNRTIGNVTLIAKSRHALHLVITSPLLESWLFTTVYNRTH